MMFPASAAYHMVNLGPGISHYLAVKKWSSSYLYPHRCFYCTNVERFLKSTLITAMFLNMFLPN